MNGICELFRVNRKPSDIYDYIQVLSCFREAIKVLYCLKTKGMVPVLMVHVLRLYGRDEKAFLQISFNILTFFTLMSIDDHGRSFCNIINGYLLRTYSIKRLNHEIEPYYINTDIHNTFL